MSNQAEQLNQASNPVQALAANECNPTPSSRESINAIRAQLGRSSAASRYAKLTDQQKCIVLYGAKLKPAEHLRTPFELFDTDQREQMRQSLMALCDLTQQFSGVSFDRDQFKPVKTAKPKVVKLKPKVKPEDNLQDMNLLIAELTGDMNQVKKDMKKQQA